MNRSRRAPVRGPWQLIAAGPLMVRSCVDPKAGIDGWAVWDHDTKTWRSPVRRKQRHAEHDLASMAFDERLNVTVETVPGFDRM